MRIDRSGRATAHAARLLLVSVGLLTACVSSPPAWAQASPFSAGTTALQGGLLAILAPFAVLVIMGLGVAAWFNKISWSWVAGGFAGVVLVFGAPQIIAWIRGMFGV